jgi:CRP/FNR family transcriptional regulator, anaerobic regulatory protein
MSALPSSCEICPVRHSAACAALNAEERAQLAAMGKHRDFQRGETVMRAGDDNIACATLVTGALKVTSIDVEGQEQILSVVHPAGFVGEIFAPIAHHDVIALTDSRLCLFTRKDYEAAVARFPALAGALLRRSSEELLEARTLLDLKGRRSAKARIAGLILAFAKSASDSSCHTAEAFDLPLNRAEIANLLGLTIETVSRQLTIIRKGARDLWILDAPLLSELAS